MNFTYKTTVFNVLQTVFPNGTQHMSEQIIALLGKNSTQENIDPQNWWQTLPPLPFDVFAFCAYLIEITGLMGYFDPVPKDDKFFNKEKSLRVVLSSKDREQCKLSSAFWCSTGTPDPFTRGLWEDLFNDRDAIIRIRDYQSYHKLNSKVPVEAPKWWVAIFMLLIIADEACDGVGHKQSDESRASFLRLMPLRFKESRIEEDNEIAAKRSRWARAKKQLASLAAAADDNVVCVQPKGRVSEIGCSLRNISRNLAITGPIGSVRCSWQPLSRALNKNKRDNLNLLMIPLPYNVPAKWFEAIEPINSSKQDHEQDQTWGNFKLNQYWLPDAGNESKLISFVTELIHEAQKDVGQINGIIFPEYALTFPLFERLLSAVRNATHDKIEFMIAGSSSDCIDEKEQCNCVITAIWEEPSEKEVSKSQNRKDDQSAGYVRIISQRKHHRWKLNDSQIKDYGLASALPPYVEWWEEHDIDSRELNFFQFRNNAVFASLICEDLARNDPCHDIIRSVAPNLIFALLMDGPQLKNRWSARYASTLADDPGSTVLTFTSRALIARANEFTEHEDSYSVGLLKDDTGRTEELVVENGKHAVVVTLASKPVQDFTIDARGTTNASSWHFINQKSISVKNYIWNDDGSLKVGGPL